MNDKKCPVCSSTKYLTVCPNCQSDLYVLVVSREAESDYHFSQLTVYNGIGQLIEKLKKETKQCDMNG